MKQLFGVLILAFLLGSCNSDEAFYTGDLTVTTIGVTTINGTPINQFKVGLFDMNVLVTNRFTPNEAISAKFVGSGKVEFKGLNPGNYVVALIEADGFRKSVQVTIGNSVTIDLFN